LPKEIEKARAHGDLRGELRIQGRAGTPAIAQARVHHLRLRLSKLSDVREQDIPRDRVASVRGSPWRMSIQEKEVYALTLAIHRVKTARQRCRSRWRRRWEGFAGRQSRAKVESHSDGKRKSQIVSLDTVTIWRSAP